MKLYKFTLTGLLAAPDSYTATDLVESTRAIKEAYERNFLQTVLLDNCKIQLESLNENPVS
jgi:hypothetical protein